MVEQTEKYRVSYLTVSQTYDLNMACKALDPFGYGTFHVGSSLTRPDYRDVDLRCMLSDEEWGRMFAGEDWRDGKRLKFLNVAISEWLQARTGLPIDFQFQRATDANEEFPSSTHRRNGTGI
jgi:hypothetical protein